MPSDKKYDSVNLIPFLSGKMSGTPHERLFWRSGAQWAVREGPSKLVRHKNQLDELYDVVADISETSDLTAKHSEHGKRLGATLDGWNDELVPPAFPGLAGRNTGKAAKKAKQASRNPD